MYSVPLYSRYMDSRFAHLRQRDASVSMLRVKMSRRRSQSQKENRERAMNTRRQLDQLPEMEMASLDNSTVMAMSVIQEKTLNNAKSAKSMALFTTRASTQSNNLFTIRHSQHNPLFSSQI